MKCYHTIDPKTLKKVFIPMCFGTIYSKDKKDCCCEEPLTEYRFEKQKFNEMIEKKNNTIRAMEAELNHLRKIIKTKKP